VARARANRKLSRNVANSNLKAPPLEAPVQRAATNHHNLPPTTPTMRLLHSILPALALAASGVSAASSWSFADATVTRVSKTEGDVKQP
jgi:hypothetical protein